MVYTLMHNLVFLHPLEYIFRYIIDVFSNIPLKARLDSPELSAEAVIFLKFSRGNFESTGIIPAEVIIAASTFSPDLKVY